MATVRRPVPVRICLLALLAVGVLLVEIHYFGEKVMFAYPLTTAAIVMVVGRNWMYRTEIVACCLFSAVLGVLYCPVPTFLFQW